MQDKLHEQLTTLTAANTSLESCLAQSKTAESKLTQASVQLNTQLQEYVEKHQQLQAAVLHAEQDCAAKAAELSEAMVCVDSSSQDGSWQQAGSCLVGTNSVSVEYQGSHGKF